MKLSRRLSCLGMGLLLAAPALYIQAATDRPAATFEDMDGAAAVDLGPAGSGEVSSLCTGPFSFRFFEDTYGAQEIFLNSNGFITFGLPVDARWEDLVSRIIGRIPWMQWGPPRIAALWTTLSPGEGVWAECRPELMAVTWLRVPEPGIEGSSNTFQITLFSGVQTDSTEPVPADGGVAPAVDATQSPVAGPTDPQVPVTDGQTQPPALTEDSIVRVCYGEMSAREGIVGVSPGGGGGASDLSQGLAQNGAVYEEFDGADETRGFDLAGRCLFFSVPAHGTPHFETDFRPPAL